MGIEVIRGGLFTSSTYSKGAINVKGNTTKEGAEGQVNLVELPTGASEDFKNYNIYDMAGNVWEWTTGHHINGGTMFVVPRGR